MAEEAGKGKAALGARLLGIIWGMTGIWRSAALFPSPGLYSREGRMPVQIFLSAGEPMGVCQHELECRPNKPQGPAGIAICLSSWS
jgi:hypothetical protein